MRLTMPDAPLRPWFCNTSALRSCKLALLPTYARSVAPVLHLLAQPRACRTAAEVHALCLAERRSICRQRCPVLQLPARSECSRQF
jgi:hypothetical protein